MHTFFKPSVPIAYHPYCYGQMVTYSPIVYYGYL